MAGIDPALLVHDANPDGMETASGKLRGAVTRVLASARDDGGLIVGSCSGLFAGMSPQLVHEMYRLVSEFNAGRFSD